MSYSFPVQVQCAVVLLLIICKSQHHNIICRREPSVSVTCVQILPHRVWVLFIVQPSTKLTLPPNKPQIYLNTKHKYYRLIASQIYKSMHVFVSALRDTKRTEIACFVRGVSLSSHFEFWTFERSPVNADFVQVLTFKPILIS